MRRNGVEPEGFFEAKKHAYRQTQDGVVVSFVVHPYDMNAELATAPLGTIYMVAFSRVGGDGEPVKARSSVEGQLPSKQEVAGSNPAAPTKERKAFHDLKPSAQAGIRCGEVEFWEYLETEYRRTVDTKDMAADVVRDICAVETRSEFNTDEAARQRWNFLESAYEGWKTDHRYKDVRNG